MFVQSEKFVEAHGGKRNDVFFYGRELNNTTWRPCRMNLAIRGIEANVLGGGLDAPVQPTAAFTLGSASFPSAR